MSYEKWFKAVLNLLTCYFELLPIVLLVSVLFGSIGVVLGFVSHKTQHKATDKR